MKECSSRALPWKASSRTCFIGVEIAFEERYTGRNYNGEVEVMRGQERREDERRRDGMEEEDLARELGDRGASAEEEQLENVIAVELHTAYHLRNEGRRQKREMK